jgi:hypothetical protein
VYRQEAIVSNRAVSRCVAVAAHGKRCQQTPHKGSPYCWHHLQSRKVPAPSRPAPAASRRRERTPAENDLTTLEPRARAGAPAARLAEAIGPDGLAQIMDLLDGVEDGTIVLTKRGDRLITDVRHLARLMVRVRKAV